MKTFFLGCYSVPDGYFGDRATCFLCFDPVTGRTLEVYTHGYHRSEVPIALDHIEAKWLVENRPGCKQRYQ